MPMTPFVERFPEVGARETRSARVTGRDDLPDGQYGFIEFYCNEPACDCRRVIVKILREDTGLRKIWATINYGWESPDFYRKWGGPWKEPVGLKGPFLDPLNTQTEHSPALLQLFLVVLQSPEYIQRLKRHYEMFRAVVGEESAGTATRERRRIANRRKRRRDPRRRLR